ncbi:MAG: hypothetical protein HY347_05890 [candidate division NC10 bacterium]|nr:hypothetical protein [candidate division NC10 bacterium]
MRVRASIWIALGLPLVFASPPASFAIEVPIHGFLEVAGGVRLQDDPAQPEDATLGEGRVQLEVSHSWEKGPKVFLRTDFIGDAVLETTKIEVREVYIDSPPIPKVDVRIGRQILTWGTGDFLFVNDLFPKDYLSFFIGRQSQYLKVASDALKASLFVEPLSLDVVAIPFFTPDRVPTGERLSFFDGLSGRIVGKDADLTLEEPKETFGNTEVTLRLLGHFQSYEVALYGFTGFFHSPVGVKDPMKRVLFYPKLNVYGASTRGPALGGIANVEIGYYDSREDRAGRDPFVENPSIKYLVGYERQPWADFTLGVQYFLDQMLKFDRFQASLPPGAPTRDELRHLLTLRLTQFLRYQTIELSLFVFYSPSDGDSYVRPSVSYKVTDNLTAVLGANLFSGGRSTPFGQLDADDNLYLRLTYSF